MRYVTIVVCALILIAVLIPGRNIPSVGIGGVDKVVHIVMFMTWAIAVRYDFDRQPFPYWPVLGFGILFSGFTEVLQFLVEDRTFDLYDMAADALGVAVGLILSGPVVRWIKRYR